MQAAQRHGVLFELLRQEVMSVATCKTLEGHRKGTPEDQQMQDFLARALVSWDIPEPAELNDIAELSAPEPGGDHEFLRTVRP